MVEKFVRIMKGGHGHSLSVPKGSENSSTKSKKKDKSSDAESSDENSSADKKDSQEDSKEVQKSDDSATGNNSFLRHQSKYFCLNFYEIIVLF